MKLTKKQQTWKNLDTDKVYALADAIEVLREYASKKFDETLEIAIRLGIDVTKADQNIRGMLSLPNGTGKTVRVAVFTANAADEAKKAGLNPVKVDYTGLSVETAKVFADTFEELARDYYTGFTSIEVAERKEMVGVITYATTKHHETIAQKTLILRFIKQIQTTNKRKKAEL